MRHQKKVAKLGRPSDQRKALIQSLTKAMLINGRIKTTDAKAKELRRVVERLITYGKKNTVHSRRLAFRFIQDRDLVNKLFEDIAPQYANRNGGYTRIIKLGYRDNDNAAVSLIEFVDYKQPEEKKKKAGSEATKSAQGKKEKKSTEVEKEKTPAKNKPTKKPQAKKEEKQSAQAEVKEDIPPENISGEKTESASETE